MDMQAGLSLHWLHMSETSFLCTGAHMVSSKYSDHASKLVQKNWLNCVFHLEAINHLFSFFQWLTSDNTTTIGLSEFTFKYRIYELLRANSMLYFESASVV